jgi:UDP-glucose 4-epimerase
MPIGPGKNRRTLIYDKDVARATLAVLTSPNSAGKIFNVTDGEVHSLNEIIQAICDALGRRVPRVHLPSPPLRVGAKILDKGAGLLGLSSTSFSSLLEKYTEDVAVKGVRIQNVTGFRPQYNIFSGWKETIEEMRARGDL